MSYMHTRFGASLNSRSGARELSIDEVLRAAPSVGAVEAHESRSARYSYIPTRAILEGMMAEGFYPVLARQGGTRVPGKANFTKHMLRMRHRSQEFTQGAAIREIVLLNSHDGSSCYHLQAGLFRVVCLNGLIAGDAYRAVKVPHKGNIRDMVIEGAFEVLAETKRAVETATEWQAITMNRDEQLVLADAAHLLRFPAEAEETEAERLARVPVAPDRLLETRRMDDRAADLWTVSNVVQENVIRGGQRGRTTNAAGQRRRASTREVTGIDQSTALNRALWMVTERMAALKTAA